MDYQTGVVETIGAGVDYFTATCESGERRQWFESLGEKIVEHEHRAGNDMKVWRFKGYEGWTSGSASCGDRPDGSIIQCSSQVADDHWKDVADCATNFSRVDVRADVRVNRDVGALIIEHLSEGLAYADTLKQDREVRIIASRRRGNTLYLNERVSQAYGRAYDKHRESKNDYYQNCIRYELECKGRLAPAVVRHLRSQPNAADAASSYVSGWMIGHGIKCLATSVDGLDKVRCDPRHTSDDRRLLWMHTQVRPSLERLARNGKLILALEALGLKKAQLKKIVEAMD
jgi:hypothetical protein